MMFLHYQARFISMFYILPVLILLLGSNVLTMSFPRMRPLCFMAALLCWDLAELLASVRNLYFAVIPQGHLFLFSSVSGLLMQ